KVILKRRASAPTFAGGLFFRGGARNWDEKNAGIETLALGVATEGSKAFPRQTLRRELARTGSSISSGAGKDYSAVSFAATRPEFDRIWRMFTDIAVNPAFAAEDVERVRRQMIAGLRENETSPDAALRTLTERVIYTGHPYANDVSGSIQTIGSLTGPQLAAYHKGLLQTSKMLLVVVGDIDPELLKMKVMESFGKLPKGSYKEQPLPSLDFSRGTVDIAPRSIPTNYVMGVYNAPSLANKDYFAMRVATTILQQLVFQEVRDVRQLSYAPNAELDNYAANTGSIYVSAVDANQAVKVMLDQIDFLKKNTLQNTVLDGMAGDFLTSYYVTQETNAAQVGELARYELIGGGWRNSFEFLNHVREVKPEDINAVANKYMKNIRFAVVGNQAAVNRSIFIPAE
ncbi:MAG TPA: pitrilysin family protein, partial [Pyrinomonadaceae bacterium]|nr:pitrilysin family protein [Pyrinomonadaceae bacterium]